MKESIIYGLIDPITGDIRYIGKTVTSIGARLTNHIYKARSGRCKTPVGDWIRGLLNAGLRPKISLIEVVSGRRWQDAEIEHIKKHRDAFGDKLLNVHSGGNGAHTRRSLPEEFAQYLGKLMDHDIAKMAGLCRESISYHRRRLGVPPAPKSLHKKIGKTGRRPHNKIDIPKKVIDELGSASDRVLSAKFGIDRQLIGIARRKLGIKANPGDYRPVADNHHKSKLSSDDVVAARKMSECGMFNCDLAKIFGVSETSIGRAINRVSWRTVK